jgi:hypothetical protein
MKTQILPNTPSGWHDYSLITNLRPLAQEKEFYFTPDLLPSSKFGVVNEYSNLSITLDEYDTALTYLLGTTPGIAAMILIGVPLPVSLFFKMTRKESWMTCGGNRPVRLLQSPRFGFSIGNTFKHQAYISLNGVGTGVTSTGGRIVWLTAPSVSAIEYSTNSRLRKFVVKHGKIIDVKKGTATIKDEKGKETIENRLYVKLFDNVDSAGNEVSQDKKTETTGTTETTEFINGIPSGEILFCGNRSGGSIKATLNMKGMSSDWYAIFTDPMNDNAEAFSPERGDFYVLTTPIMCEDPQTMFEFNVRVQDEVYITNEQKFKLDTKIIGIWNYDEKKGLQVAYVDKDKQYLVHLPSEGGSYTGDSGEYIASPEERVSGEYHDFGGSLQGGIDMWQSKSTSPSAMRIIFENTGSTLQNFCSGNLVGEYIKSGTDHYEIIDHPRLDTIEVSNASADGITMISSINASIAAANKHKEEKPKDNPLSIGDITIYQQKFWKIAELYGLTGVHDGAFKALWSGQILSLKSTGSNEYEVKWKTSESHTHLFLPDDETERTQIKTLPERFSIKVSENGVIVGGRKYSGWKIVINNVDFKVVTFKLKEDVPSVGGSDAEVTITATVQGDPSTYASVGSGVYVVLDEPFDTALGTPKPSNSSVAIWTEVARTNTIPSKPCLYMYGFYDAGKYSLPTSMDTSQRLAISNFAYGFDSLVSWMGVPAVWVSTYSSSTGIAYLQHGNNGQQTLLYKEPTLGVLAAVTADPGWIERRSKSAIRCGLAIKMSSKTKDKDDKEIDSVPPDDAYMLTSIQGEIKQPPPNGTNVLKGYFIVVPASTSTPYHSVEIFGNGGIETPLTRKTIEILKTDVHPVQLPFEVYEPITTSEQKITIGASVIAKKDSVILSQCGFQEIKGNQLFNEIKKGTQLPWAAPDIPATSFEFSKARQVLQGVKQFQAHMLENGNVLLLYSKDSAKFYFNGQDIADSNQNRPSTFAVFSNTNIENWGSPKFDRTNLNLNSTKLGKDELEWERPLMLVYDFDFVTSIKLLNTSEFLVFGYAYGRNNNESVNNDASYLFLGCYLISSAGLQTGLTHKCRLTLAGTLSDDNIANQYYYRPHHVKSTDNTYSMEFGTKFAEKAMDKLKKAPDPDPTDVCIESFTRIIGGVNSGAFIGGGSTDDQIWNLSKDIIGVDTSSHGIISVYFRDPSSDSILRIWSCSNGKFWNIEVQDVDLKSSPPIRYATGSSPTIFKDLLFYFFGDSLYCKKLSMISEGSYVAGAFGSKQEQLDNLQASLVASNVVGHKVAPNIDPYGRVVVFYLSKSGNIRASASNSSGQTWSYLKNW